MFTKTLETENASFILLNNLKVSNCLCWGKSNPNHPPKPENLSHLVPDFVPLELKPKIVSKEGVGVVVDVWVRREVATTQSCNLSNQDTVFLIYHRALHIHIRTSSSSFTSVCRAVRSFAVTKARRLCSKDFFWPRNDGTRLLWPLCLSQPWYCRAHKIIICYRL